MRNFANTLKDHYDRHPEKISLILQQAGKDDLPVTYHDLIHGATGWAELYRSREIKPGEVIILIMQHTIELVYAYFGAILHGAIPSILPYLTEKLSPERYREDLASLIGISKPAAIVTFPEFEEEVRSALHKGDSVRAVILTGQDMPTAPDFSKLDGMRRDPDEIVLLQHSSGTTGLQKGIALSHRSVFNQLDTYTAALKLTSEDVIVSWLPLYHDMGLIACYLMPILYGITLVIMSPFDWVRAPYRLMQAVTRYRGTLSWLPNFAYVFCAEKIRDRDLEGVDLSSWRAVTNCSEPVRITAHEKFAARFTPYGLNPAALVTSYAMAENTFAVSQSGFPQPATIDLVDREAVQTEWDARPAVEGRDSLRMLSSGRPIRNTRVRIFDPQGKPLPDRKIGEVGIQSDCMLSGFFHRDDLTRKAFLDGWYLTGDYGYLADGELYVTGRKKDLIIVGGKNIYPADLEQLAMEVKGVHPGRVVAFGVFNEETGTEEVVIVSEVDEEDPAEQERIANEVRKTVTKGSAVALRHVYLVPKKWILKTSSGKTARPANKDKYLKEMTGKH
ncbi:MAG: fatty acyl-AMP ligase [Leptolinea sp.]|jgi:acyl-CoA synthetase (AMP-forming)/AMP-acid ligase II|nr:fatty acyl-AMP ligase [Leptolinea sp.]